MYGIAIPKSQLKAVDINAILIFVTEDEVFLDMISNKSITGNGFNY